jgi:hypothetical protein
VMSTVGFRRAPNYTAIALGVLLGLAGIIVMIVGVSVSSTLFGVIGFGILFAGVMVAVGTPGPGAEDSAKTPGVAPASNATQSGSFMDRLNERWERRERGEGL